MGTVITVLGAIFVTLYKGPAVSNSSTSFRLGTHLFVFASSTDNWVLGAIFLAGASLSVSIWNVIQVLFWLHLAANDDNILYEI